MLIERNGKTLNPDAKDITYPESDRISNGSGEFKSDKSKANKKETDILIAARNGITEMVEAILEKFPVAVNDVDAEKKNIVLLAVETRQVKLYKKLLNYHFPYNESSPSGSASKKKKKLIQR